jgi:hypothetical protein
MIGLILAERVLVYYRKYRVGCIAWCHGSNPHNSIHTKREGIGCNNHGHRRIYIRHQMGQKQTSNKKKKNY